MKRHKLTNADRAEAIADPALSQLSRVFPHTKREPEEESILLELISGHIAPRTTPKGLVPQKVIG